MSYLAETSNMTTRRNQPIAVAGLAPAGQAALQAATQMDTDEHGWECNGFVLSVCIYVHLWRSVFNSPQWLSVLILLLSIDQCPSSHVMNSSL